MSHIATVWAWKQPTGNPLRKLVLLHMADSVSEQNNWQSWYSLNKIAERCDCSRGAVRTHIKALVDDGFLTMTNPSTRHGRPAKYRLNVGTVEIQIGPGTNDEGGAPEIQGGAEDVPEVVQEMYHPGTGDVPKPVMELVSKPVSKPKDKVKTKHYFPEQEEIVRLWNDICQPAGMPKILSWEGTVSEKDLARIWKGHSVLSKVEAWEWMFFEMAQNDWCCGKSKPNGNYTSSFRVSLRWLVKDDNASNLLERLDNEYGSRQRAAR